MTPTNLEELKRAAEARLSSFARSAADGIDIAGEVGAAYGPVPEHPQWQRVMVRQMAGDVASLLAENDRLRSELEAERERRRGAEQELARLRQDREYIVGWSDGFNHACSQTFKFPTMLRKMWSGTEVQKWLNEEFAVARAHFQSQGASNGEQGDGNA